MLIFTCMTASQSLKIYELLLKYFDSIKAKQILQEIESVFNN